MVNVSYVKWFFLSFLVIAIISILTYTIHFASAPNNVRKSLRFNYEVKNTSSESVSNVDFYFRIPMEIKGYQRIESILTKHPYSIVKYNNHAQSIKISIDHIAPYSSALISVDVVVDIALVAKTDHTNQQAYLGEATYIEVNSDTVQYLKKQFPGVDPLKYANEIHDWLHASIKNIGYMSERQGAELTLNTRKGDCTDHMYSSMALARANNIPARGIAGFYTQQTSTLLHVTDYHNWAELFIEGRWVLSDSQKNIFDESYSDYVIAHYVDSRNDASPVSSWFYVSEERLKVVIR